jgi:hypothetical protein
MPGAAQAGAPRAPLPVDGCLDGAGGSYAEGAASDLSILREGRVVPRASTRPGGGSRVHEGSPAAFPEPRRVRQVRRFVSGRASSSFALVDTRGRLRGFRANRLYVSASVSKALLLVAYLRRIGNRPPTPGERAVLGPMITRSANRKAGVVFGWVGDARLVRLARRAGMRNLGVAGHWSGVSVSAADLARFFYRFDRLVPPRSRAYARRLLASIVPRQRWGFSRCSLSAGWSTFFKGGWRRTAAGRLVHEAALFERGGCRFALAVLSDGNPSHRYGTATLRGVASRLFGHVTAAPSGPEAARQGRSSGLWELGGAAGGRGVAER